METIELTITTKSALLLASGKSDGLIDSDIYTDQYGLPTINKSRLQNTLKESILVALEKIGHDDAQKQVKIIFGQPGEIEYRTDLIIIEEARICEYEETMQWVRRNSKKSFATDFYSQIITPTAINRDTGAAKKGTLRKLRAVKEGVQFTTKVHYHPDFKNFAIMGLLELRSLGTYRNRGFGKISIDFNEKEDLSKNLNDLINSTKLIEKPVVQTVEYSTNESSNVNEKRILLKMELTQNALFPKIDANENIMSSLDYIPGRRIWGMLAVEYIKKFGVDNKFKELFGKGEISFTPGFKNKSKPIPLNFQSIKNTKDVELVDVFVDDSKSTKYEYNFHHNNEVQVLDRVINFHMDRSANRTAGASNDGEIFYYEALGSGQNFYAELRGKEIISLLKNLIGEANESKRFSMGRAHGKEYGNVKLSYELLNSTFDNQNQQKEKLFQFCFSAPAIVLNKNLFAEPSLEVLKTNLINKGLKVANITKAVMRTSAVQHFSRVWKAKDNLLNAFEIGSAFEVCLTEEMSKAEIDRILENGIGEKCHQGYGLAHRINSKPELEEKEDEKYKEISDNEEAKPDIAKAYAISQKISQAKVNAIKKAANIRDYNNNQLKQALYLITTNKFKSFLGESKYKQKNVYKLLQSELGLNENIKRFSEVDLVYYKTIFDLLRRRNKIKEEKKNENG